MGTGLSSPQPWLGVCFDLDGVLIDTMPLHAIAWQHALRTRGLRVSRRLIYEWEGESGIVSARRLLAAHQCPQIGAADLLADKERRFAMLARDIRVPVPLQRLLRRIRRRHTRLALVTGTSSREVDRILPQTIRHTFDALVTGDRVRRGKPHPEPYLTAVRALHIPAHRAIVVENAPYGIRSAQQAGAGYIVALASSLPRRYLQGAHVIVGSVRDLIQALDELVCPD